LRVTNTKRCWSSPTWTIWFTRMPSAAFTPTSSNPASEGPAWIPIASGRRKLSIFPTWTKPMQRPGRISGLPGREWEESNGCKPFPKSWRISSGNTTRY